MVAALSSPVTKTVRCHHPRILRRRRVEGAFRPKPRLVLPGLMHATVLPDLELVPLPGFGYDLTLPELPFASISASRYDGPTLHRLLDRLQIQPR